MSELTLKSQFTLMPTKKQTELIELKDNEPETVYAAWKTQQTPQMGSKLLRSLEPAIGDAVQRWTGSRDAVAMSKARSLVIDSLPRYNPDKSKMSTFVNAQLQPLQRWRARKNIGIKVPTADVQQMSWVQKTRDSFEDEYGRSPSSQELADRSGIPISKLNRLQQHKYPVIAERAIPNEDGEDLFMEDAGVSNSQDLWSKTIYHSLNPVDQFIFEHSMGLYGAAVLSNTEIARRLKLTPGAISQRKSKLQTLLDSGDK